MRKAYHLKGEAAVLHVFSVECPVLQLPLLSLLQRMRKSWAYCACAKAYHLEGEAAVLHVFSVECAVLQLPLLSLLLFGAPLRVRPETKAKDPLKGQCHEIFCFWFFS